MLPLTEDSKIAVPFLPWDQMLEKLLGDIVVHTLSVLLVRKDIAFLQPLLLAFTDPFQLQHQYLPTMPDDIFSTILSSLVENEPGTGWMDTIWSKYNTPEYWN
jgi:hypothetical protein